MDRYKFRVLVMLSMSSNHTTYRIEPLSDNSKSILDEILKYIDECCIDEVISECFYDEFINTNDDVKLFNAELYVWSDPGSYYEPPEDGIEFNDIQEIPLSKLKEIFNE